MSDFFSEFDRETKRMARGFGAFAVLTIVLNFAFWGGLIWLGFWCAKHFGVIG